ncbi:sigma-70 family RNA polymerase sigma factor [Terrimonas sp. NA20]|uniref:Sigma-70 family RNA polymerase sigma factor n=1 Tax=Terrimonas ginsenosidimutans TaxID=2908004 RepID=A0ABS9KT82_9BACT|nr:sigma-70 family RNA polymerase sigma factor [Terrimonas ginsenosidimutans]MCG2615531.1 sigma-70 family RNA polymerase sigma factor [Terrimonas ginsenosidimutans]
MKPVSLQQEIERSASAFRQGMPAGMTYLFNAWYVPLCQYICSLINDPVTAEEIASEAFLKTWKYRLQFHSSEDIRAYLFTIARRDAFKWTQQKQKAPRLETLQELTAATTELLPMIHEEIRTTIHNAIQTLPNRCRQVFELLYIEDKNIDEVASSLLISPYTVRAQKARGLSLLRPKLLSILEKKK